jgi:tape measure domain-containing protein
MASRILNFCLVNSRRNKMGTASEFVYTIKAEYAGASDLQKLSEQLKSVGNIKSFEKLSGDIEKTEQKLDEAEKKAAALKATMEKSGTNKDAAAYAKSAAEVDRMTASLEKQNIKLEKNAADLKKAGISTTELAAAQKSLSASTVLKGNVLASDSLLGVRSFSAIKAEIASLETAYKTLASGGTRSLSELAIAKQALQAKVKSLNDEMTGGNFRVMGATKDLANIFRSLANAVAYVGVAAAATAAGGLYAFQRVMVSAVDQAVKMGQIERSFIAISGSGKLAGEEMKFVQGEAAKLGLELTTTADAYKGIWAASKGTVLEGEATRKIFSSVASAASALGLSTDQTSGALLAISQMMPKGKIQAEELRGQLGERLPGAFQLMAQAAGVSTAKLDAMLQAGQVGIDILPRFADILREKYGTAAVSANSYGKSLQQLKNEFGLLKTALGESVTNNTFVIESMKVVTGILDQQKNNIINNRQEWMTWGKQSALSVLEFAADFADGIGGVYKGLERTAGVLNIAYAGSIKLGQGYQYLFEQSNRAFGNTAKADYWAKAQRDSAQIIEDAMKRAAQDFSNADVGLTGLDKAAQRIRDLKAQLEKIPATYKSTADQMENSTKEIPQEIENVGGVWKQVTANMSANTKAVGEGVTYLGGTLAEYERKAKELKEQLAAQQVAMPQIDTKAADESIAGMVTSGKAGYKDLFNSATTDGKGFFDFIVEANKNAATIFKDVFKSGDDSINGVFDSLGKVSVNAFDSMGKYWGTTWDEARKISLSAIGDIEQRLSELTRDRTVTVHVREISDGGGSSADGYALGGLVQAYALGGSVFQQFRRLRSAYITQGSGLRDDVPALLKRKEFVQPDWATDMYGLDFMEDVRSGRFPVSLAKMWRSLPISRFSIGGQVAAAVSGVNLPFIETIGQRRFPLKFVQMFADGGPVGSIPTINKTISASSSQTINHDYGGLTVHFPANTPPASQLNIKDISRQLFAEWERQHKRRS